jgi:hypothetical protein
MAGGSVPEAVAPYLCGANLFGAKKKCGGVRPIAVGNLLRRLTSKCFSFALADRAATLLGPHQLGVGIRGGIEAIIHTVREVLQDGDANMGILQIDLINAYNMADRDSAFREVEENFPDIIKWVLTSYGSEAELVFGKQGDYQEEVPEDPDSHRHTHNAAGCSHRVFLVEIMSQHAQNYVLTPHYRSIYTSTSVAGV